MTRPHDEEIDWSSKTVFSTGEAAQVCRVSQQTIIRCFDSGKLQGFRVPGSKFRRIPRDELIRFMRDNSIPVSAIEGSVRRVLCVHGEGSPVGSLAGTFAGLGGVELRSAHTGFDAGWQAAVFRPHMLLLDAGFEACSAETLRDRLEGAETVDRPVIVEVHPGSGRVEESDGAADWVAGVERSADELVVRLLGLLGGGASDPAGGG